ncbi:hypothetical protein AX16_009434 [Volvariella volvacea WC 439]|nr:hypothetical protein AX16_009434 [Volvariella volvacea WC 439]
MSFLTRLFRKKSDAEDYETILANLAKNITARQTQLSEIRLRQRRATLLVTLYTIAAWVAYATLWYLDLLPRFLAQHRRARFEKTLKGFIVVVGPIVILFVRRIVQIWYQRIGDAEEKTLRSLLKEQRDKVEEMKQKTNYNTTLKILEKYGDGAGNGGLTPTTTPIRLRPAGDFPIPNSNANARVTPPPAGGTPPQRPQQQLAPLAVPMARARSGASPLIPQTPLSPFPTAPPQKRWYDKLADAVLGDDDQEPNPAISRYALICERCFAHNGLVKESMWEDAQYVCPKCGHFNASARSKRDGRASASTSPNRGGGNSARSSVSPTPSNRGASPSAPANGNGNGSGVAVPIIRTPPRPATGASTAVAAAGTGSPQSRSTTASSHRTMVDSDSVVNDSPDVDTPEIEVDSP